MKGAEFTSKNADYCMEWGGGGEPSMCLQPSHMLLRGTSVSSAKACTYSSIVFTYPKCYNNIRLTIRVLNNHYNVQCKRSDVLPLSYIYKHVLC
jgi:hypothetical protein